MHATDEDKGVNGQVKYSIVQQPNQKGTKFTVNEETGEVSTNKVRDACSVNLPRASISACSSVLVIPRFVSPSNTTAVSKKTYTVLKRFFGEERRKLLTTISGFIIAVDHCYPAAFKIREGGILLRGDTLM